MPSERAELAKAIFAEAIAAPPEARASILAQRCSADAALRAELESLLGFHDPEDQFLERSAVHEAGLADAEEPTLGEGARIGRYTILSTLGAGGMGVVYRARQDDPSRVVALKVMKPGFMSASMARRFRQEAALLGMLQHPAIAQVYDAGKDPPGASGTPYLAMELVQGSPITTHARAASLPLRARLQLFLQVCEGVHHAHQRGVIHRDLKPANILVTPEGRVKILDFGIARLAEPDPLATMATAATLGGQLLGTLAYMSPEQASGDPRQLDVRADVYALGVILYELLAGRLPIDVLRCALPEAVRRISTHEPPRLGTIDRAWRGDLEIIAARALEKDRARRYPSAADLAEDVRRTLAGEPIRAKQDSALYVLGKTVRRHRWPVAAALASIAGLAAFAAYAWVQSGRERGARRETELALRESIAQRAAADAATRRAQDAELAADAARDSLARELHSSNVERGRLLAASGSWRSGARLAWTEFFRHLDSPQARWALREIYARNPVAFAAGAEVEPGVHAVAYTPDSRLLVYGHANGFLCVCDADSGEPAADVLAAESSIREIAFHPALPRVATVSVRGTVSLWDLADPAHPALLWSRPCPRGPSDPASSDWNSVDITADGSCVLACPGSGPCVVLDATTGTLRREYARTGVRFRSAYAHPDARHVVIAASDDQLVIADLADADAGLTTFAQLPRLLGGARFSPDGSRVFAGGRDSMLGTWDFPSARRGPAVDLHNGSVRDIEFSPTGRYVAVSGYWEAAILDADTLERAEPSRVSIEQSAWHLAWRPDGTALAASGATLGLSVWSLYDSPCVRRFRAHPGNIARAALSAEGSRLLTIAADGAALWHLPDWSRLSLYRALDTSARPFVPAAGDLSPDGSRLVLASRTGLVRVVDAADGRTLDEFALPDNTGPIDALFSADASDVLAMDNRGRGLVRDWASHTTRSDIRLPPGECMGVTRELHGPLAAAAQRGGLITLLDTSNGVTIADYQCAFTPWRPSLSPDGTRLAMGTWTGGVETWDARALRPAWTAQGHTQMTSRVAYSPDGRTVASSSTDGHAKLWDAATGAPLATPTAWDHANAYLGRARAVTNTLLTPDGHGAIVTYADGTVEQWDWAALDLRIARNAENAASIHGKDLDTGPVLEWARGVRDAARR